MSCPEVSAVLLTLQKGGACHLSSPHSSPTNGVSSLPVTHEGQCLGNTEHTRVPEPDLKAHLTPACALNPYAHLFDKNTTQDVTVSPAHLHLSPRLARMACLVLAAPSSVRRVPRQMFVSLCLTSINSELPWLLEKHQLSQCGHALGPLWVGSIKARVCV